jgi:hypothetical protein
VVEFAWTGRLDDAGLLWFDLGLKTADYDEDPPAEDPPEDFGTDGDWVSPLAWRNYHACSLSSTKWEDAMGLLAATPDQPFRFADPRPRRLAADPLPIDDLDDLDDVDDVDDVDDLPAFHIYLLGHDSVAAHEVEFTRRDTGRYDIAWTGRIARTYVGDEEFRYRFRAEIRDAVLAHVDLPHGMTVGAARRHLSGLVDIPERFVGVGNRLVLEGNQGVAGGET